MRAPTAHDGASLDPPDVSVVVLAYGAEEWLGACLDAIHASMGVDVEIIVVDNGTTNPSLNEIVERTDSTLITPRRNLGFTGGCNEGASYARGPVLAFINSDAIVEPACLAALSNALEDRDVGAVSAQVLLAEDPERINSVGNPVHISGLSWAGGFGEPRTAHRQDAIVAGASGAAMAMRTQLWQQFGGFWGDLFAYLEDTELSLRCWQRGLRVEYVAGAVVHHYYQFSRNGQKMYLLERNRLMLLLTLWEGRTLLLLSPMLVLIELLMLALAVRQHWIQAKLRGWVWCIRHASLIRDRRQTVQAQRVASDTELRPLLTTRIQATNIEAPPGLGLLNAVLVVWCRFVFRSVPAGPSAPGSR